MKTFTSFILLISTLLISFQTHAQSSPNTSYRPPRVLEVEKMLNKEALEFLKARFPGRPFIVNVTVDPLLRVKKSSADNGLPYYELADNEHFEEWEDPNFTPTALISRVKKISFIITVPADLSEDELTEIKGSLMPALGMMESRDNIEIRKRSWLSAPANDAGKLSTYHILIISALILLFLAGLLGVMSFATSKVGAFVREAASQKSNASNEAAMNMANSAAASAATDLAQSNSRGMSSDVKMLDSLKFLKHVSSGIAMLEKHKDFPRLEDMLIFENFIKKDTGEFGAFLSEMPVPLRMRIFSLASSIEWMKAMNSPTDVGNLTLEELQRCLRLHRDDSEANWQNFLILVWRLQSKGAQFFNEIPEKETMTILAHLPKGLGVKIARDLFPGSWAQILDISFKPEPLSELLIEKYSKKALELMPLFTPDHLKKYNAESELIAFVRTAPVLAEKEIYLAAGENSRIREIRPPFYPFFSLEEEQYKTLIPKFSTEEWALALFNSAKPDRVKFESQLPPKLKSRIYEYFKKFDSREPSPQQIADIKDRIGAEIAHLLKLGKPKETPSVKAQPESPLKVAS